MAKQQASENCTCQINEVEAAVCSDARHIVQAVHNDSQHTVGPAAALVHFGLCNRAVALAQLHDLQHVLCAGHLNLQECMLSMTKRSVIQLLQRFMTKTNLDIADWLSRCDKWLAWHTKLIGTLSVADN